MFLRNAKMNCSLTCITSLLQVFLGTWLRIRFLILYFVIVGILDGILLAIFNLCNLMHRLGVNSASLLLVSFVEEIYSSCGCGVFQLLLMHEKCCDLMGEEITTHISLPLISMIHHYRRGFLVMVQNKNSICMPLCLQTFFLGWRI